MKNSDVSIFKRPLWVTIFALTAAIAWGWAYPLIKLGFAEFGITQDMTGSKMLFAGVRFSIAGLIVLAVAAAKKRSFAVSDIAGAGYILLFALLNTTLHYAFFYIGLSHSGGARAAILNSLSVFMLVVLACFFFKSDRLTVRKIVGCIIGFAGVLVLNVGGGDSGSFSFMGDGMIVLNALCAAFAGLMTRGLGSKVDVFVGTGYSLAVGGFMLLVIGIVMGGKLPYITLWGVVILLLLVLISSLCFTLYNKLLTCNPVGKVAIFNSLIPVVGAVTSCLCLKEQFYWSYLVAALLAMVGIYIINKGK
ncbi:MAG: DMT family transporter [Bacteroidaceae bacterium]|nr:DMT family transporter [Bacteroidaceae bacterium]